MLPSDGVPVVNRRVRPRAARWPPDRYGLRETEAVKARPKPELLLSNDERQTLTPRGIDTAGERYADDRPVPITDDGKPIREQFGCPGRVPLAPGPGTGPQPAVIFLYASPSFRVGRSGRPLYL